MNEVIITVDNKQYVKENITGKGECLVPYEGDSSNWITFDRVRIGQLFIFKKKGKQYKSEKEIYIRLNDTIEWGCASRLINGKDGTTYFTNDTDFVYCVIPTDNFLKVLAGLTILFPSGT
jgi:hypothetical protein